MAWQRQLNKQITMSIKVCSNHFTSGYCSDVCRVPTLYLNGYDKDEYQLLFGGENFAVPRKMARIEEDESGDDDSDSSEVITPCLQDHDYVSMLPSEQSLDSDTHLSDQEKEIMEFLNQQLLARAFDSR